MKAAVLHAPNQPMTIEEVSLAKPKAREVLVRTAYAGLCHSDLHFIEGLYPHPLPAVLGHEVSGVVEAVGGDVTYLKPGDHVIGCLSVFCGACQYCTSGRTVLCDNSEVKMLPGQSRRLSWEKEGPINQFLNLSAFAEQMVVHENALVKIDPDIPLDRAALVGCGVITGVGAVMNTARVPVGSTVAVIGCGGVGLSAVNGAALAGASRILALDTLPEKLVLAKELGATDTVLVGNEDPVQQVRDMTGGGVEYSFECLGLKATAEQAFAMLRPGGTATIVGMVPFGVKIELHGYDFLRERKIQGSSMGSNHFRTDMPRLLTMWKQGRLKLDHLISRKIALDEINDAFARLKGGHVVRQLIDFGVAQ
jgi:S-(hydroxymethyl)glutathione dehydrogenase / alcohol dehydrogenase